MAQNTINNLTLLFPGQGSQYVGMGKKLKDSPSFEFFKLADEVLKYPLTDLCMNDLNGGDPDTLKQTQFTQPAILTYSIALYSELKSFLKDFPQIKISTVLGHSVGEISALCASNCLSPSSAIHTVYNRGLFMQKAVPLGLGGMSAVLRLSNEKVEEILNDLKLNSSSRSEDIVECANFNDPEQTVISGHLKAIEKAKEAIESYAKKEGLRIRIVSLPVSAPFHCSLMQTAKEQLSNLLQKIPFKSNEIDYIANVDAKLYTKGTPSFKIIENLTQQVTAQVQWTKSLLQLPKETLCVEVGPSQVLKGLLKKTRPDLECISLDEENAFEKLRTIFENSQT